ncbi:MAG: hypothetical protein C4290_01020 [Chloroflexota bacterium]
MEPRIQRSRQGTGRLIRFPSRNALRIGASLIALLLLVLFVLENARTVRVRFLMFETDTWLAWALVVAAVLGFLVGLAWPWFRRLW